MRILMISKALVTGVYQKKLEELASLPDVELLVVVPPRWVENRVGVMRFTRQFTSGYDLVVEPMRFNGHHHIHYYPGLAKRVRQFNPDLIHIDEEPYNFVTAHATWLARRVGARSIFFTWQNLDRRYPPPFSQFERYAYGQASAAIAGNEDARNVLRRKGFRKRIDVIPQFGIDPTIFSPRHKERECQRFTVGYYGRLVPEKGIDTLIDAVALMKRRPQVVIVGSGESQPELQALAERRGVADSVEFRGSIPGDAIPEFLSHLDAVVIPSRTRSNWKEQFGRVIIEAMACEVPVIGSDSGEIPNVIGDAGLVFPEGDAAALAARVTTLMEQPEHSRVLGLAGRARVLSRYTQEQVARSTWELYRHVLHGEDNSGEMERNTDGAEDRS